MIKHISLASSSSGNAHLLSQDDGKTFIMLDCGLTFKTLKTKLFKLGIHFHQIKGCLITHEHMDHIKGIKDLSKYVTIYITHKTYLAYSYDIKNVEFITANKIFKVKEFTVMPFSVKHDCADAVNYLIMNKAKEYTLYITDTGSLDFNLKNIRPTYIIIEANYDLEPLERIYEDVLDIESQNEFLDDEDKLELTREQFRVKMMFHRNLTKDNGHMSIQKTIEILKDQINLNLCKRISLCHVSKTNGKEDFHKRVEEALGGLIAVKQLSATEIVTTEIKEENEHY